MKPWNQAAWKQNTYRARKTVGAVGAFPEGTTRFSSDPHCKTCGYHVHAPTCAPLKTPAERLAKFVDGGCVCGQSTKGHSLAKHVEWHDKTRAREQALSLAALAKLPVGTRVVVETGDRKLSTGTVLRLAGVVLDDPADKFALLKDEHNGTLWSVGFEESGWFTFRFAETKPLSTDEAFMCRSSAIPLRTSKPPLLTLAEAGEACRAGKVVRCVEGWDRGVTFQTDRFGCFEQQVPGEVVWSKSQHFPKYVGPFLRENMRFEVVE